MSKEKQLDEAMLHAYLDGELDAAGQSEVEQWLASHRDDMQRVSDWRQQKELLKKCYDPVLSEPVPQNLKSALRGRLPGTFKKYLANIAAALVLFVSGGVAGWFAAGETGRVTPQTATIASQALGAHLVYAAEVRHPVEVSARNKAHLAGWLSKRLGQPLTIPDLTASGFELIGGRLLASNRQPAAQFMYENRAGQRLTLYIATNASGKNTAFRLYTNGPVKSFYWLDGQLGYAVSGELARSRLLEIARKVYHELEKDT
ncbi:MAG TPA: anti-sigma factor [Rhizobiales bacterium]|nr:anti-sigma factor [Hyphomicrobiales bacterium]